MNYSAYYFFSLNSAIAAGVLNFFLSAWPAAALFTPRPSLVNVIKGTVAAVLSGIFAAAATVLILLAGFYVLEDGVIRRPGIKGLANP